MRRLSVSRILLILAGLAVSGVFTYLAVRDVDVGLFWDGLRTTEFLWLVPALVVMALAVLVRVFRWQLCFSRKTRPRFGPAMRATLVGLLFNSILPVRAGEAVRIVVLHRETGTSRAEALGTVVVERLYDVLALLLLFLVATPFLPDVDLVRRVAVLASGLLLLVVVLVVMVGRYGSRPIRFLLGPLARLPGISGDGVDRAAANLVVGLGALHRFRLALPAFAVTVGSWMLFAASFWLVLAGFDLGLGLDAGLLVLFATTLVLLIPSLPAAIGVFEAATIAALKPYGIDESQALSYAVLLHGLNLFPAIAAGYVALHWHAGGSKAITETDPSQPA